MDTIEPPFTNPAETMEMLFPSQVQRTRIEALISAIKDELPAELSGDDDFFRELVSRVKKYLSESAWISDLNNILQLQKKKDIVSLVEMEKKETSRYLNRIQFGVKHQDKDKAVGAHKELVRQFNCEIQELDKYKSRPLKLALKTRLIEIYNFLCTRTKKNLAQRIIGHLHRFAENPNVNPSLPIDYYVEDSRIRNLLSGKSSTKLLPDVSIFYPTRFKLTVQILKETKTYKNQFETRDNRDAKPNAAASE